MKTVRIGDSQSVEKRRIVNTSAGCYLVRKLPTQKYELLLIRKKWKTGEEKYVLPKGHIEGNESLEEAAIRETIEESGYTDFELLNYLGSITYELDWREIQVKTDHYFLSILISDKQNDINKETYEDEVTIEIIWIDLGKGFNLLTYETQKEIHKIIKDILKI